MATDSVRALNAASFSVLLATPTIFFVDFCAKWCAPCTQFAPIYARVAADYPDIVFTSIDIEQEHELAEAFHIRSIPHLMVFKEGIAIYSESGSVPESVLHELAKQAKTADVSALSKRLENGV